MWLAKVALIMYIFSVGSLFFTYYINTVFPISAVTHNPNTSFSALQTLAGSFSINQQINSSLIFGDFLAGLTVFFNIVTGTTIANAFSIFPFVDASVTLLVQIVFTLSSAMMWIYIVANRSV